MPEEYNLFKLKSLLLMVVAKSRKLNELFFKR